MDKPDVDMIEGLSPAISIDQKTTSKNPRSTVATVTEIYDYLRLLYARVGHPYCPKHDINKTHSIEVVIDSNIIQAGIESRLTDSLETALSLGEGRVIIDVIDGEELIMNEQHACPICGFSIDELEPRLFSFKSPYG